MRRFFFVFLLLPLFYLSRKSFRFRAVIPSRNHTEVFRYLSDVTKFRVLNPTIINVTHWERVDDANFLVKYTERLSQVPAVKNEARAHYRIYHDPDGSHALISRHLTCFFADFLCLATESTLRIGRLSKSQVCYLEDIFYSCPWLLSGFCYNEVAFQRREIAAKLKEIFSSERESSRK